MVEPARARYCFRKSQLLWFICYRRMMSALKISFRFAIKRQMFLSSFHSFVDKTKCACEIFLLWCHSINAGYPRFYYCYIISMHIYMIADPPQRLRQQEPNTILCKIMHLQEFWKKLTDLLQHSRPFYRIFSQMHPQLSSVHVTHRRFHLYLLHIWIQCIRSLRHCYAFNHFRDTEYR